MFSGNPFVRSKLRILCRIFCPRQLPYFRWEFLSAPQCSETGVLIVISMELAPLKFHVRMTCMYVPLKNSYHVWHHLTWKRSLTQRLSLADVSRKTALICFANFSPSSKVTALSLWKWISYHQVASGQNPCFLQFLPPDLSCCQQEQRAPWGFQQDRQSCRTTPGSTKIIA